MGASFYRNSECCALVCDLTDLKSFEAIESWRTEFLNQLNPKDPDTFHFVLLGNKCDKAAERKIQAPKIKQYCETKANMPKLETSGKDNTNVEAAFEEILKKMKFLFQTELNLKLQTSKPNKKIVVLFKYGFL